MPIPLGLESGDILNAQLTSSSDSSDGLHNVQFARLNQAAIPDMTVGGWTPDSPSDSWLQIDFRVLKYSVLHCSMCIVNHLKN